MKTFAETRDPSALDALLLSVQVPEVSDEEAAESLSELERLVSTLGFRVVGREKQKRPSTHGGTLVGEGKLKEIKDAWTKVPEDAEGKALPGAQARARLVVTDCDLSPSQLRNLEKELGCEVLDRTGVIIEIFSRHARTRAAKLQVEIARLNYMAPRLREQGAGKGERQAGRGAGESALELDRRHIRDRVAELKLELESVQREQAGRREKRAEQRCVALVGYTNAGKSSSMRALTGSDVLVEDKLFATLDTTVRALQPEAHPRILVSDTVGFIKKLPHDLVASFRSTLDEAHNAALLLFVVDASDKTFRAQLAVTYEVLDEVGVQETPSLLVLNKWDRVPEPERAALLSEFPEAFPMCTREPGRVRALHAHIVAFFEAGMEEAEILAPYDAKGLVGEIRGAMRVLGEDYGADGVRFRVRGPTEVIARLRKKYGLPDSEGQGNLA
jgi:GTP-binding protein HflX